MYLWRSHIAVYLISHSVPHPCTLHCGENAIFFFFSVLYLSICYFSCLSCFLFTSQTCLHLLSRTQALKARAANKKELLQSSEAAASQSEARLTPSLWKILTGIAQGIAVPICLSHLLIRHDCPSSRVGMKSYFQPLQFTFSCISFQR